MNLSLRKRLKIYARLILGEGNLGHYTPINSANDFYENKFNGVVWGNKTTDINSVKHKTTSGVGRHGNTFHGETDDIFSYSNNTNGVPASGDYYDLYVYHDVSDSEIKTEVGEYVDIDGITREYTRYYFNYKTKLTKEGEQLSDTEKKWLIREYMVSNTYGDKNGADITHTPPASKSDALQELENVLDTMRQRQAEIENSTFEELATKTSQIPITLTETKEKDGLWVIRLEFETTFPKAIGKIINLQSVIGETIRCPKFVAKVISENEILLYYCKELYINGTRIPIAMKNGTRKLHANMDSAFTDTNVIDAKTCIVKTAKYQNTYFNSKHPMNVVLFFLGIKHMSYPSQFDRRIEW